MGIVSKSVGMFAANSIALYIARTFIPGFELPLNLRDFLIAVSVLTLINLFLRPIIKLFLAPLIIITLGLASILINVLTLLLLDYLLTSVTISGLLPLLYSTLILGIVNLIIHLPKKT